MATTLVGIFDDYAEAQSAAEGLVKAGIKQSDIAVARNEGTGKGYTSYGGAKANDLNTGESVGEKISDFFGNLFGSDDAATKEDSDLYAESVRRGSTAVTVRVEDNMTDQAADILNENGAVDVDRRAAQYRAAGYKGHDPKAAPYNAEQTASERKTFADQNEEIALPVIEEQLNVGKRVVQRGGVRVHTSVSERPVEETISLREENVTVNRRPVDRALTDADTANFKDGDFTVTTQGEEAVVGKTARVVEEVVVGKNVTEREETVRDSVKRTDVEVEQMNQNTDKTKSQKAR